MKVRNLIGLLAQRTPGWITELRRRKASDYGAILVGVAMMGAMHANAPVLDDSTVFAAVGTPPSQMQVTADATYDNAGKIALQTTIQVEPKATATPTPAAAPAEAAAQSQNEQQQPAPSPAPAQNPAPAPTATPTPESRPLTSSRSERPAAPATPAEQFIAKNAAAATESMHETGVPASVTLAQAILESDSGRSGLSVKAQNYFGIKATTKPGPAGVVSMDTWEHVGGQDITVAQPFRAYHSAEESFADHGQYLRENSRYAEAMKHADDARQFARLIHQAGYATDPAYASKLVSLMDRYNLYQYDR